MQITLLWNIIEKNLLIKLPNILMDLGALHQCYIGIIFSKYHSCIFKEDFTSFFFNTSRVCMGMGLWGYLCFWYNLVLYAMQEPSYLDKMILVSLCSRIALV